VPLLVLAIAALEGGARASTTSIEAERVTGPRAARDSSGFVWRVGALNQACPWGFACGSRVARAQWRCLRRALTTRWSGRAGLKNMTRKKKASVPLPGTNRPPHAAQRPR